MTFRYCNGARSVRKTRAEGQERAGPGHQHGRTQPVRSTFPGSGVALAARAAADDVLNGPVDPLKRLFGMGSGGAAAAEDGMDGLFCSPDVIRGDGADMMEFETHNVLSKLDFEEV